MPTHRDAPSGFTRRRPSLRRPAMSPSAGIVHVMGWHSQQYGSFERFLVALAQNCSDGGLESHFVFQSPPRSQQFMDDAPASFHVVPPARGPIDPVFLSRLARL